MSTLSLPVFSELPSVVGIHWSVTVSHWDLFNVKWTVGSSCWFLVCSWYFKSSSVAKTVNAGCRFNSDCTPVLYMLVLFGEPGRWGMKLPGIKFGFYSEQNSCIFFWNKISLLYFQARAKPNILKKKTKVGMNSLLSVELHLWREFWHMKFGVKVLWPCFQAETEQIVFTNK